MRLGTRDLDDNSLKSNLLYQHPSASCLLLISANKGIWQALLWHLLQQKIYLRCVSLSLIFGPKLLKVNFKKCQYWALGRRKIRILLCFNGSVELL